VIVGEIATGCAWTVAQLGASPTKFEFRKTRPRARRSNSIVATVANANATGTGTLSIGLSSLRCGGLRSALGVAEPIASSPAIALHFTNITPP
jgi:hypothetical protein